MKSTTFVCDSQLSDRTKKALAACKTFDGSLRFRRLGDIVTFCEAANIGTSRLLNLKELHVDVVREIREYLTLHNLYTPPRARR